MKQKFNLSTIDDKEFVDIPASMPEIKFPLQKVGIHKRKHYIQTVDPFTKRSVTLLAELKVFLNLPGNQRGLHMSRIEGALHQMEKFDPMSLEEYTKMLCKQVKEWQGQEYCQVEISAFYEHTVDKNISKRPSHELLTLHCTGELDGKNQSFRIGLSVPFLNACPCAKRWAMREFYHFLQAHDFNAKEVRQLMERVPFETHTNRGEATLFVSSNKVTFNDLYIILGNSTSLIRELLKGEDEHELVKKVQQEAYFCEDITRSIALNAVNVLDKKVMPKSFIEIVVDVDESVHVHNLYAEIKDTFRNIKNRFCNIIHDRE